MKALRALMLVLVLCVSTFAGNIPFGRDGHIPCGKAGNMPTDVAGEMDTGKTGEMPNGRTAALDPVTLIEWQMLHSVLPLL